MEVENLLPPCFPNVEEELVSYESFFLRKLPCFENEESREMGRLRSNIGERGHEVLWDEENMRFRLRSDVPEREYLRILKHNIRRDFPVADSMKDRLFFHRNTIIRQ